MNTRQKIILTPSDSSLIGKINPECEHCHILCDTTTAAFTVQLPSVKGTMQRELIVKNIGAVYSVTLIPRTGQYFDNLTIKILTPYENQSFWPDNVKTWWMI